MTELSIKIKIGDREYPMRVDADEEELLRYAGKLINEKMKVFHNQFGIDDKQDLLAMVAFDTLVEGLKEKAKESGFEKDLASKIEALDKSISTIIPSK